MVARVEGYESGSGFWEVATDLAIDRTDARNDFIVDYTMGYHSNSCRIANAAFPSDCSFANFVTKRMRITCHVWYSQSTLKQGPPSQLDILRLNWFRR